MINSIFTLVFLTNQYVFIIVLVNSFFQYNKSAIQAYCMILIIMVVEVSQTHSTYASHQDKVKKNLGAQHRG